MKYAIEPAAGPLRAAFLEYCAAHGNEHDESYVPDREWPAEGEGAADHPCFALVEDGRVAGAGAGLFTRSFRAARRLRFAVLHAQVAGLGPGEAAERYASLARAVAATARGLADSAYLFFPEERADLRRIFEELGFRFERTAFLMGRDVEPVPGDALPAGYRADSVRPGDHGALSEFVAVRNRNFREVLGSTDAMVEDFAEFMGSDEYLEGGLVVLRAPDGSACGTLRLERDDEEGSAFIGTISVDRGHRQRGLGTALLRLSVRMARDAGFRSVFLSVNAENRSALPLYLKEGFTVRKAMSCMNAELAALL